MAVNPLDGLTSVAVGHQLISSSTAELKSQLPRAAGESESVHGRMQITRRSQESRKWHVCGSGPNSACACESRTLKTQHSPENAARERSRVRNLRQAFHSLQSALPSVPPDTKLSKLDVLVLATNYIAYLTEILDQGGTAAEHTISSMPDGYLHPVKKWPMRSLLYCGSIGELLSGVSANQMPAVGWDGASYPLTSTLEANQSKE
ncbi:transcription factor 24-like [Betta splendens]|uniref:Transcription factor 24-like n=1 Tax=Betta splendens TaxID=158456 RepID=A0A6P7LS33_BETSP|nr:transcription factor 24-like [Betta splendens]